MSLSRTTLLLLCLGAALLIGCGGRREPSPGLDGGRATDAGRTTDAGATDGGGSGLDPTRLLTSLDMTERRLFCADYVARFGTMVTECDGGLSFTPQTVDDCAADMPAASCTATVGDVDGCFDALDGDLCSLFSAPACSFILTCATSSATP